jgi:hypothetical protein
MRKLFALLIASLGFNAQADEKIIPMQQQF